MSEMTLEDYASNPMRLQCGSISVEPHTKNDSYLSVTILDLEWASVAFELSKCDDDFIECFINRVRKMQSVEGKGDE